MTKREQIEQLGRVLKRAGVELQLHGYLRVFDEGGGAYSLYLRHEGGSNIAMARGTLVELTSFVGGMRKLGYLVKNKEASIR